jgi:hypothetical protein
VTPRTALSPLSNFELGPRSDEVLPGTSRTFYAVFDGAPKDGDLDFEVTAAPDGVDGYRPVYGL